MNFLIQHLRRAALLPDGAGMSNEHLLGCFIERRDEAAFEMLVRRHGPMVWGVCRRLLHNHEDAEDAFQAAFLVLARKANSIVPREMVGNWLYGVAYQTALKARAVAAERRRRERQVAAMPEPEAPPQAGRATDWQPLLDQTLSRLPHKYRVPIVLCDLEGKTYKEAAQQLGWPEGTFSVRLLRARDMLARRLTRGGMVVTSAALAVLFSDSAAPACVPASLVASTVKAACLSAAGHAAAAGAISVQVAALTEGVLKAMLLTKLKMVTTVVLLALLGAGSAVLAYHAIGAERNNLLPAQGTAADEAKPDGLTAKQVLDRMAKVYSTCKSYHDAGVVTTVFVEAGGNRTVDKPFTTAFVRPDRFRFEYREKKPGGAREENRHIVWRQGNEVQSWWDVRPGIEKPQNVGLALGGAAGVSGGSATAIPALLFPGEVGGRLSDMTEVQRIKDTKLDKAQCFRINGKFGDQPTTLWIDKATFLIRRIEMQMQLTGFRAETAITYDPALGGKVDEKKLAFDPPQQK